MKILEIPEHWEKVKLHELFINPSQDIVDGPFGSNLKAGEYKDDGVPIIRVQNIGRNRFINQNIRFISEEKAKELTRHNYRPGDIVLNKLGEPVGKACIVPDNFPTGIIIADLVRMRVEKDFVNSRFLTYQINSIGIANQFEYNTKGTTRPRVKLSIIRDLEVCLPHLKEQNQIVEKIEELFSELENSIKSLTKSKKKIIAYRQSILRYAFEGKLTEGWRLANKPENAEKIISSIKNLRLRQEDEQLQLYQNQLDNWRANGRKGEKPNKPGKAIKKLIPFSAVETLEFTKIPADWNWVKIDILAANVPFSIKAGPFGSSLKKDSYQANGPYKIYGQEQVIANDPQKGDYFISTEKYQSLISSAVTPNDILISLVGTVGKVMILPEKISPGIINPRLIKITIDSNYYSSKLFKYYFESAFLKNLYSSHTHGATMDVLNLGIIQNLPFPLMSLAEQNVIVDIIESQFSLMEKMEQTIEEALLQLDVLREGILEKAFTGKLTDNRRFSETGRELLDLIALRREELKATKKIQPKRSSKPIIMNDKKLSVLEVLQKSGVAMPAKDVWQQSEFRNDIEAFYSELKKIQGQIKEVKNGSQSLLSLQDAD